MWLTLLAAFAIGQVLPELVVNQLIAFRYDAERVVVYTASDAMKGPPDPQQPRPTAPPGSRRLSPPLARYPGPHIVEVEAEPGTGDRVGDRWTIDAAPGVVVTATAESAVFGGGGCFGSHGVMARVDEADRDAFEAVRSRYHVAQRGERRAGVRPSPLGAVPYELDADRRAQVESILKTALARAVLDVTGHSSDQYANADRYSRRWAGSWQRVDAELRRGRGVLAHDVQSFVLTPDGDPRLYIRAELRVAGATAFGMSFWLRDRGGVLSLESSDSRAASQMRMREYGGPRRVPLRQLGEILAVVDSDDDGWGEVLVTAYGYEGRVIASYEYSPTGPQPTGVKFAWGC